MDYYANRNSECKIITINGIAMLVWGIVESSGRRISSHHLCGIVGPEAESICPGMAV
jgi:hypothetical protein